LLDSGADPNAKERLPDTDRKAMRMLVLERIAAFPRNWSTNMNLFDGFTPLHYAMVGGHTAVVQLLCDHYI
jgi:hypothetical protein